MRHRTSALLAVVVAAHSVDAALPSVDFDRMGKVGLAGAFAGLDLLSVDSSQSPFAGVPLDPSTATLFSRSSDGALTRLGSTNAGGSIVAGCALDDTFYFAGSFDSFQGTQAKSIASYSPSTGVFNALGGSGAGVDGPVNALYCDDKSKQVWVGGSFKAPTTGGDYGGAVAIFSPKSNSWSAPAFGGLQGSAKSVFSITSNPASSSLYLTGSFIASFEGSGTQISVGGGILPVDAGPPSSNGDFSDIHKILCPTGDDGADHIRSFKFMSTSGIRLGQTFVDGRGTKLSGALSAKSLPDNANLTLRYVDPTTGEEKTCSDECPLVSDKGVPYQDFLYADGPRENTGVQITLRAFDELLLSDGAYASADPADNGKSCYAPGGSSVDVSGDWKTTQVPTDIPGTTQEVRTQNVPLAHLPAVLPRSPGNYDVFLLVPGCNNMQDCGGRTSVKVTTSPGGGLADHDETVSQTNTDNARLKVYSGPVVPAGPDYKYHLVADRVQLVLTSDINGGNGTSNGTVSVPGQSQQSFGFFEWPLSSEAKPDEKGLLPNTTITAQDGAGFNLTSVLGTSASSSIVRASAQHSSGKLFLAGNLTLSNSASNIVAFDGKALAPLANNGVNGGVAALAIDGDTLYIGGAFTDTATASGGTSFNNIVKFNVASNQWEALASGLDGPVHSLSLLNGKLYVAGHFAHLSGSGQSVGGFAVWDTAKNAWVPSGGLLVGTMSVVAPGTNDIPTFVAGNAIRSAQFGADGLVMLETGKNGQPVLKPLGASLDTVTPSSQGTAAPTRRAWMSIIPSLFARQSPSTTLPAQPVAQAPAVLAGAFWTNSSTSKQLAIFGGNFSYPGGAGVALYDADSATLTPLQGTALQGTVQTLLVVDDLLFIGGEFTHDGANGFAIYDLAAQAWQNNVQALQPASGGEVVVRSVSQSPKQTEVIFVAGSFATAGSLPCQGVCSWNTNTKQWSALGAGIRGEVSTVVYAGNNLDTLVVGGVIQLPDNTASNVAAFSVQNATWTAIGGGQNIPGPVTALEVNNGNASSIFAAGKGADGSSTFLIRYDGVAWQSLNAPLSGDSTVAQLAMVPLTDQHSENGIIQQDRMLWLSGTLSSSEFGDASSVLYDGQKYYPYLASTQADGSQAIFTQRKFLATGIVILISIAIAAGIVFLLALIGILWTLFARRDENNNFGYAVDDDDSSSMHRPSSLLAHINEATRKTIFGGDNDDPFAEKAAVAGGVAGGHDDYQDDDDGYRRAETPAVGGGYADDANRPAHARYSFEGTGAGELPVSAGTQLIVLDDRDPAWWFVRDVNTGREGVVPAAYIF
ncbi:cortical protein marker for cell polarity-domain-containing protein [Auriculariales sp. MPI-PUGE-AT-0066]|nr:cortical protein marker for cell polarity-domain-containing protein [Auriculariales sp. MPI-PUGE-AT-0066]